MDRNTLKDLLNNILLLRWVRKFTANNLLDDNELATKKFNLSVNKDSVSIMDKTATKLLVTKSEFNGEEYVRYSLAQLNELIDSVGKEGELIIPANSEMREMIAKIGNDIVVVCPLPKSDKKK